MSERGTLYVIATPIGHLSDVTERARATLAAAHLVVAEDTRRSGKLLEHLGIDRPLRSAHKFSEARKTSSLIALLEDGSDLALITDGGTPGISDPGHRLVAAALAADIAVVPVPGPSALAAALSVSGLPAERCRFEGFLPARRPARRRRLEALRSEEETIVFYEAPHRLLACLEDLVQIFGDRRTTICREMTKMHEEIVSGTLGELARRFAERASIRGEVVIVTSGDDGAKSSRTYDDAILSRFVECLAEEGGDRRRALRRLARELDRPRRELKKMLAKHGIRLEAE